MFEPVSTPAAADTQAIFAPAALAWRARLQAMRAWMAERGFGPERVVVLVPYAQLMDTARRAWAALCPSGLSPRFESSRNWATNLAPFVPGPMDWSGDMARDSLVAAALVERVGTRADPVLRAALIARLVEAARSLAPLAAAVAPTERLDWAQAKQAALTAEAPSPAWEGLVAQLAVTWVGSSAFATDVLWAPLAAPGTVADGLIVLQGFQQDPLALALLRLWGEERCLVMPLHGAENETPERLADIGLHTCGDAEDEAQRAAACVLRRINTGQIPVALVANDRVLVRRVSALLHGAGVAVRDETGWKLSTTHAAAQLMALLRAADPRASMDEVIDALKLAPRWVDADAPSLEGLARRLGVSSWRAALEHPDMAPAVPPEWRDGLASLQAPRTLEAWLVALGQVLNTGGWWAQFAADAAGQQILNTLRLHPGAGGELTALGLADVDPSQNSSPARRWTLTAFTGWVSDVLEGASFTPKAPSQVSVVILPLAQQVGRDFAATVVPGCDERNLPTHPEPPPPWTPAQRALLGLPGREVLALASAMAWQAVLGNAHLDVLWRTQDRGEVVMANAWVDALQRSAGALVADPREPLRLNPVAHERPAPSAPKLLPSRLSASAYQDLRDCPYRFFALRQLRLQDADELETEPDQRDMGNWLHAVLRGFHEERRDQRPGREADVAALNRWAHTTSEDMGLHSAGGEAGFLPFQAVWPALREGYVHWLYTHEATPERPGPAFDAAEAERTATVGRWRLLGKLDRIDHQPSPEGALPMVIDYKTESRARTKARVKEPMEDTQLAFYAALMPEDTLRAAYLSIADQRSGGAPCELIEQVDVLWARDALREGLENDMERVAAGHAMPALGEGRVCEFCAARGLCRRDDWSAA